MSESHSLSRRARLLLVSFVLLLAAGIGARLAVGAGASDRDEEAAKKGATLEKAPDGKPAVQLVKGQAEALDLQTALIEETTAREVLPIHGVVLDPSLFLDFDAKRKATGAALRSIQAAEAAAQAELSRVTSLHASDQGASDKALQEAQRVAADATAQRVSAEGEARKAQAAWSQNSLDSTEGLGDFSRVVVRLDLPMGITMPSPMPKTLRATSPGLTGGLGLRVLGLAPGGSPLTGGLALLAVAPGKGLRPGLPVDAPLSGDAVARVLVPRAAVIWSGGEARVFVQVGEGRFEPRTVAIAFSLEKGLVVSGDLSKSDRVVSQGALALEGEYERLATGEGIGAGGV